jgi:hypothetical protein
MFPFGEMGELGMKHLLWAFVTVMTAATFGLSVLVLDAVDKPDEELICHYKTIASILSGVAITVSALSLMVLAYILAAHTATASKFSEDIHKITDNKLKCSWCEGVPWTAIFFMAASALTSFTLGGMLLSSIDDPSKREDASFVDAGKAFGSIGVIASVVMGVIVVLRLSCFVSPTPWACGFFMGPKEYKQRMEARITALQKMIAAVPNPQQ